jgi:hypothetical protein
VPLLVAEPGSARAASLWAGADRVVSVRLMCPETRAALAKAARRGSLTARQLRDAVTGFARSGGEGDGQQGQEHGGGHRGSVRAQAPISGGGTTVASAVTTSSRSLAARVSTSTSAAVATPVRSMRGSRVRAVWATQS